MMQTVGQGTAINVQVYDSYKISDRDTAGAIQYYGYLKSDGHWMIVSDDGNAVRYIVGAANYTTSWNNRAGLTYVTFDQVIL